MGGVATEISFEDIAIVACDVFGIRMRDLLGKRRSSNVVRCRFAVAWMAREETGMPLVEIGLRLGGRHHTTTVHALQRAADLFCFDQGFSDLYDELVLRVDLCAIPKRLGAAV